MATKFRFDISNRLITGFVTISLVVLISFGLIFNALHNSNNITERNIDIIAPSVLKTEAMNDLVSTSKMLIKSWVFIDRQADTPDKLKLVELHQKQYPKLKAELDVLSAFWPDNLKEIYKQTCTSISDTLFPQHNIVMKALGDIESYDDPMIAFDITPMVLDGGEIINTTTKIHDNIAQIISELTEDQRLGNESMQDSFQALNIFIIVAILIIIVVAIFSSIFTIRSITKPIALMKASLEEKSEGVFREEQIKDNNDEVGDMALAVQNMSDNILGSVNKIKKEASALGSSSSQISKSAEVISNGANMQATSTEEVSASIEEMTQSINKNAQNAQNAGRTTKTLGENIEVINNSINNTTMAMNNIADKVKVISEIANKVDMLAINASIEAARAGQAGKGFGVVASEVRKLAENTAKAAKTIEEVSQESVSAAAESKSLIEIITPQIKETISKVQQISVSSVEQSAGIQQVKNAIIELGEVTQQNAASSEELFASSTELLRQSDELKDSVSFFKTPDDDSEISLDTQPFQKKPAVEFSEFKSEPAETKFDTKEKGVSLDLKDDSDSEFSSF